MLKRFNQWWKLWGQVWGFVGLIVVLNGYFLILSDEMQSNEWLAVIWLVLFFGGAGWYVWQMRKHGWRLPKDIRDTH